MCHKKTLHWRSFALLIAVTLIFSSLPSVSAQDSPPEIPQRQKNSYVPEIQIDVLTKEAPINKVDPVLREIAQSGGSELVRVYVSVKDSADISVYLIDPILRPEIFPGMRYVLGLTPASMLLKIASHPGVISIVDASLKERERPYDKEALEEPPLELLQQRIATLQTNELTYQEAEAIASNVGASGWFDVSDGHRSSDAWAKGFTGEGVIVGVIDDGVDFAHPDLIGTTARITDPDSPYFGWPMAFSQASTEYFVYDVFFGTSYITDGATSSMWSDTSTSLAPISGVINYQPLGSAISFAYTVTGTSLSNTYKIGSMPEQNLQAVHGHRVAVLVVDEAAAGVYDTVYVDLDNDKDFSDEKPNTKNSPEIYRDMDGDGFTDISGGMLVWISDSANTPPITDWMWGITCLDSSATMAGCPSSGELVLFTGPLNGGYTHGTQCASNVAGKGAINEGLSAQPFSSGGMVQGAAPDVGIMDFGDFYLSFLDEDHYFVATLGYDGIPYSGDEVQITSNSYGAFEQMWGGWGYIGRALTALNFSIGENTVHIFSAGNEGPGYGPQEGDSSPTVIQVGSSSQYGSTNWDSIFDLGQIEYGDPSSYYSKGPNRDGSIGVDVLANGGRGAGDEGVNYFGFNGAASWSTWGGTSRSAPVAAGNLALVFDAFEERYGRWPTWQEAKSLLKSGATNSVSSPFFQGGGIVNANRSTDLAAGLYGVYATPDEWRVGDWNGTKYVNFASVAYAGESYQQNYEVHNPSDYAINVELTDGIMTKYAEMTYTFTTADISEESTFNFHAPDYLIPLPTADIPLDAEVMIVRYVHPYDTFDPNYQFDGSPDNSWRFLLYNWTDQDGNGKLWVDSNANGAVNHADNIALGLDNNDYFRPDFSNPSTEIDEGEYIRMDYEFGGLNIPIIIHEPHQRMADGYFFGLQHRNKSLNIPKTSFIISVEYYKRSDWNWLSLSEIGLNLTPRSSSYFTATVNIPIDTEPGAYEGVIFMNDPGDIYHDAHETALPVIINVIAELNPISAPPVATPSIAAATQLGGRSKTDLMYQNSWSNGYFNWYGGGWTGAGDWRHYFLEVDEADAEEGNLLVHSWWDDGYPTDFNTWILGPTEDCASNAEGYCVWWEPGVGQPDTEIFGPYTLQPIASSSPFLSGSIYPFETSTGGPDDWLMAPLDREGLYEIALHNVLYSGEQLSAQFGTEIGTIDLDATMAPEVGEVIVEPINADSYVSEGEFDILITPSLALPDMEFTLADGLETITEPISTTVTHSNYCQDGAACPETVWETIEVTQTDATRLEIFHQQPANQDIDFFLFLDQNENDVWDQGIDIFMDSSTNYQGDNEYILVENPIQGTYLLGILGWELTVTPLEITWNYSITSPGEMTNDITEIYSDTIEIYQDHPFDFRTASYSMTLTTDERTSAIFAELTEIPVGADVDLYLTDGSGNVIDSSSNSSNLDESVSLIPQDGDYRFGPGEVYIVWAHGLSIPISPVNPHLRVTKGDRNIWISSDHPDVIAHEISAGETISVTIHYSKANWDPGDPSIYARIVGGPSVIGNAFDELISINRVVPPSTEPAAHFLVSKTPSSSRGLFPEELPDEFGLGTSKGALIAPNEAITYEIVVTNDGDATGTFLLDDYWGNDYLDFVQVTAPASAYTVTYELDVWEGVYVIDNLDVGESVTITVGAETTDLINLGFTYPNFADVYDYYTEDFHNSSWAGAVYQDFSTSTTIGLPAFSDKFSTDDDSFVVPNQTFDYVIELTNPSSVDVMLTVIDPLPDELNYISGSPGIQYDSNFHQITWTGQVPGSSEAVTSLTCHVIVKNDVPEGTVIFNEAEIQRTGAPIAYLSDTIVVDDLLDPDIRIEKFVNQLITHSGQTLHYTINISNEGSDTAHHVELIDPVPSSLMIDVGSITGGANFANGVLTWLNDIPSGGSATITFNATVNEGLPYRKAIINRAQVTYDEIPEIIFGSAASEIRFLIDLFLPLVLK